MIRILTAAQLQTQPANPVKLEGRTKPDSPTWAHVVNLSPYTFELQDDTGIARTVVPAFRERAYKVRVRTEKFFLAAVATSPADANFPAASYAVYWDLVDECPYIVGGLVT